MNDQARPDGATSRHILLIGRDEPTSVTDRVLRTAGARVTHLRDPNDREVRKALRDDVDGVVVISNDDHVSLRTALVIENLRPGVPLVVTVFGRIVVSQLQRAVQNVRVMSIAEIGVPSLAGPCFDEALLSVSRRPEGFAGVRVGDDGPELVPIEPHVSRRRERIATNVGSLLHPFEVSMRILLAGLLGFLLILILETAVLAIAVDASFVEAFYSATKTIVTVGPNPLVDDADAWLKVFSAVAMLLALAFTAIFTAGVVDRLIDRRLTAIVGKRAVPRRDHVVVVGFGQVGLRLCLLLQDLGIPVLAVEVNPDNHHVNRAKEYGIPVVIGRGGSRFLLRRLCLPRARALAAVTSHEVENISIVVAALGMHPDLRTLLRAGRGEVVNETRSLFAIGVVRDTYRISGTLLAAVALGQDATGAFLHERTVHLIMPDGRIEAAESDVRTVLEAEAGSGELAPGATATAPGSRPAVP